MIVSEPLAPLSVHVHLECIRKLSQSIANKRVVSREFVIPLQCYTYVLSAPQLSALAQSQAPTGNLWPDTSPGKTAVAPTGS